MAGRASVVLRLRTKEGHSRIEVSAAASLEDVVTKISQHLQVPRQALHLYLDQRYSQPFPSGGEAASLPNGTVIYVKTEDNVTPKIAAASPAAPAHMTTADLPPEKKTNQEGGATSAAASSGSSSASSSGLKGANSSSPPSESSAGGGVTFKSFDAFLRERKFAVNDLPGSMQYKPRRLESGRMNRIPPTVTLKHQVYRHVDHLEMMNVEEVKNFVQFWQRDLQMLQQRFGYMLGYYVEDSHYPDGIRAVCEAIYEPPQENTLTQIDLKEDKAELEAAEKIAQRLGLETIGCIFTHAPREELLTADEVIDLAKMQLARQFDTHYTGYPVSKFVCCTVSLHEAAEGGREAGEAAPNAFMISDMGMSLVRDGVICEKQPDASHVRLRRPERGELLPQILESGKETTQFDARWFIVRVNESAPRKVRSFFCSNTFPRENRLIHQSPKDITEHLAKGGASPKTENWRKFSDFHLLLYVAKLFDLDTALSICDCIVNQKPVDEGLEDTLKSLG